jgi:hypothetical protein
MYILTLLNDEEEKHLDEKPAEVAEEVKEVA